MTFQANTKSLENELMGCRWMCLRADLFVFSLEIYVCVELNWMKTEMSEEERNKHFERWISLHLYEEVEDDDDERTTLSTIQCIDRWVYHDHNASLRRCVHAFIPWESFVWNESESEVCSQAHIDSLKWFKVLMQWFSLFARLFAMLKRRTTEDEEKNTHRKLCSQDD